MTKLRSYLRDRKHHDVLPSFSLITDLKVTYESVERKAKYILYFCSYINQLYIAPSLQLIHVVIDNLYFSCFEDVTLDAGVDMDGYRNGSALSQGTYTFGSSFTVSYLELTKR